MSFFDTLCNPDTCSGGSEETELGPEEQGHQYFERGNYVAAASIWIDMVEHYTTPKMGRFPPPAASALSARTWLRLGLSLEAHEEQKGAEYDAAHEVACYRNVLARARAKEKELQADAHYYLACAAERGLKDSALAEREYRAALKLNAGMPSAYNNLGLLLSAKQPRDLDGAERAFRHAIDVDPTHANARYNLAMLLYAEKGALADACRLLALVARTDARHAGARAFLNSLAGARVLVAGGAGGAPSYVARLEHVNVHRFREVDDEPSCAVADEDTGAGEAEVAVGRLTLYKGPKPPPAAPAAPAEEPTSPTVPYPSVPARAPLSERVASANPLPPLIVTVRAPPGNLGALFQDDGTGTAFVVMIKSDSKLLGQLKVRDVIAAVDGANTEHSSASDLVGLLSRKEHAERVLTVHRKPPPEDLRIQAE